MVSTEIQNITLGSTGATAAYLGDRLFWPLTPPSPEYVDCGCIYGSGSENLFIAIGSGYIKPTTKFRFLGKFLSSVGSTHLGAYNQPDNNDYRLFFTGTGNNTYLDMGNQRVSAVLPLIQIGETVDITVYNLGIIDNVSGDVILSGATTATTVPNANFQVNIGRLEVQALQIWETSGGTDVLLFDGVPKIRWSDNKPGLYDNVRGNFFTSNGTVNACYYPLFVQVYDDAHDKHPASGKIVAMNFNGRPLFTDANGNALEPINGTPNSQHTSFTFDPEYDKTVVIKFDKPVAGVDFDWQCYDVNGVLYAGAYPSEIKLPSSVTRIGNLYDPVNNPFPGGVGDRVFNLVIPEGVEVISGGCLVNNATFINGSVSIPSTVQTIGMSGFRDYEDKNSFWSSASLHYGPKLFYYNGTYDEYNNITWLGETVSTQFINPVTSITVYSGYPVRCTDGLFLQPKNV